MIYYRLSEYIISGKGNRAIYRGDIILLTEIMTDVYKHTIIV